MTTLLTAYDFSLTTNLSVTVDTLVIVCVSYCILFRYLSDTYSVDERFIHEIITSTQPERTVSTVIMKTKHNMTINVAFHNAAETDWKTINACKTVRQVADCNDS